MVLLLLITSGCGRDNEVISQAGHAPESANSPTNESYPRIRTAPSSGAPPPAFECEAENYPCSWGDAEETVWPRSVALADQAAGVYAKDGLPATVAWLKAQAEIVSLRTGPEVAGFRLEGGRYMWVGAIPNEPEPADEESAGNMLFNKQAPDRLTPVTSLTARALVSSVLSLGVPSAFAYVVGPDQNEDGKINQRDHKRALILAPFKSSETEMVRSILESSRFYAGRVEVFNEQTGVGWQKFLGWEAYDIIHVKTVGISTCETNPELPNNALQDDSDWDCQFVGLMSGDKTTTQGNAGTSTPDKVLEEIGLDTFHITTMGTQADGTQGPVSKEIYTLVTPDFFLKKYGSLYPNEFDVHPMDKKIVYLNAAYTDNGTPGFYERIFGLEESAGTLVVWEGPPDLKKMKEKARRMYKALVAGHSTYEQGGDAKVEDLLAQLNSPEPIEYAESGSWILGHPVRAREIVTIVDEEDQPLLDGMAFPLDGTVNDGVPDAISSLRVKVEGLFPDRFDTAYYPEIPAVRIEVDNKVIGEILLVGEPTVDGDVFLTFENLPLGFDLKPAGLHEIDAVMILPGIREQGESRYSVQLSTLDPDCQWSAEVLGLVAAGLQGEAMGTAFTKSGDYSRVSVNFHQHPSVDAFLLVPDPDTPLSLNLGFAGALESGTYPLDRSVLWGRTWQLSQLGTGHMDLIVHKNPQASGNSSKPVPTSGQWADAGVSRVTGEFEVEFDRIQSWMTLQEKSGPVYVRGRFAYAPGCINGLKPPPGSPKREPSVSRERREGLVPQEFLDSLPGGY